MNFWYSTTLENSYLVSSHATTYDEGLCSWASVPEQRKLTSIQKSAHKCHSSFIHHSSKWKQPRQLSMGERLNKVWCVPSVKCGSVAERTNCCSTYSGWRFIWMQKSASKATGCTCPFPHVEHSPDDMTAAGADQQLQGWGLTLVTEAAWAWTAAWLQGPSLAPWFCCSTHL